MKVNIYPGPWYLHRVSRSQGARAAGHGPRPQPRVRGERRDDGAAPMPQIALESPLRLQAAPGATPAAPVSELLVRDEGCWLRESSPQPPISSAVPQPCSPPMAEDAVAAGDPRVWLARSRAGEGQGGQAASPLMQLRRGTEAQGEAAQGRRELLGARLGLPVPAAHSLRALLQPGMNVTLTPWRGWRRTSSQDSCPCPAISVSH